MTIYIQLEDYMHNFVREKLLIKKKQNPFYRVLELNLGRKYKHLNRRKRKLEIELPWFKDKDRRVYFILTDNGHIEVRRWIYSVFYVMLFSKVNELLLKKQVTSIKEALYMSAEELGMNDCGDHYDMLKKRYYRYRKSFDATTPKHNFARK